MSLTNVLFLVILFFFFRMCDIYLLFIFKREIKFAKFLSNIKHTYLKIVFKLLSQYKKARKV